MILEILKTIGWLIIEICFDMEMIVVMSYDLRLMNHDLGSLDLLVTNIL